MRIYVAQVAAAAEQRGGISLLACAVDALLHISVYSRVHLEIGVDELFGLRAADAEALGEPEGRDAIDDAEVGRFGAAALLARDLLGRLVEDLGCRGSVDVVAEAEVLDEAFVAAQVCHDAELHLRVVGREEELPGFGAEGFANLAPGSRAHGNILQVRLGAGEASGGRDGLVE